MHTAHAEFAADRSADRVSGLVHRRTRRLERAARVRPARAAIPPSARATGIGYASAMPVQTGGGCAVCLRPHASASRLIWRNTSSARPTMGSGRSSMRSPGLGKRRDRTQRLIEFVSNAARHFRQRRCPRNLHQLLENQIGTRHVPLDFAQWIPRLCRSVPGMISTRQEYMYARSVRFVWRRPAATSRSYLRRTLSIASRARLDSDKRGL